MIELKSDREKRKFGEKVKCGNPGIGENLFGVEAKHEASSSHEQSAAKGPPKERQQGQILIYLYFEFLSLIF